MKLLQTTNYKLQTTALAVRGSDESSGFGREASRGIK